MQLSNHISRERLADLAARPFSPDLDSTTEDAHLSDCPSCRSMLRSSLRAEGRAPDTLSALLMDEYVSPCLQDNECARYVRGQMDVFEREGAALHIADCAECREIVQDLEEFEGELAMERPSRLVDTVERFQEAGRRLQEAGASWLQQLSGQVSAVRESLRPAAANFAFSSAGDDVGRQKLEFSDASEFTGSYRIRNGTCQLHIEHATCPAGTLALLEASDPTRQVVWRQFIVFRRGLRRAVVDLTAQSDLELRFLSIGTVAADALPDEASADLVASFAAAGDDAVARSAWAVWAERALETSLSPAIRSAVNEIRAASDV